MSNEADTCRTYILPKLHAAGWVDDYISEKQTPTTLTTSKILTTRVNASTCRNVVSVDENFILWHPLGHINKFRRLS